MDIVERLRSPEVFLDTGGMVSPVAHEAADEIERLREALRLYACNGECANCYGAVQDTQYCGKTARAALGEGK